MLNTFKASIEEYATDKQWYMYVPLWLFGLYVFVKLLAFNMLGSLPIALLVPYSFDFTLHEFAHLFTAFMPAILTASAGSISELLLGTGLVIGAFWFRNYFASLFCCLWFDLAAQSAGTYMADAIPQRLPLVSLGGALSGQDPVHDWHFVFGQLHMLGASAFIGNGLRFVGHAVGLFGVAFSAYMLYKMAAAASPASAAAVAAPTAQTSHAPESMGLHTGSSPLYPNPSKGPLAEHQASPPEPTESERKTPG